MKIVKSPQTATQTIPQTMPARRARIVAILTAKQVLRR